MAIAYTTGIQGVIAMAGATLSTITYISHCNFHSKLSSYCTEEKLQLAEAWKLFDQLNGLLFISALMSICGISCSMFVDDISMDYPAVSTAYILVTVAGLLLLNYLFRYSILHEEKKLMTCCRSGNLIQMLMLNISLCQLCNNGWFLSQHWVSSRILVLEVILTVMTLLFLQWKLLKIFSSVFGSGLGLKVKEFLDDHSTVDGGNIIDDKKCASDSETCSSAAWQKLHHIDL